MQVGTISIPEKLVDMPFEIFKKYHSRTMASHVSETAEEVYVMLGGKLPDKPKEKKKVEKTPE